MDTVVRRHYMLTMRADLARVDEALLRDAAHVPLETQVCFAALSQEDAVISARSCGWLVRHRDGAAADRSASS